MELQRYWEVTQARDAASLQQRLIAAAEDMGFGRVMAMSVDEDPSGRGEHTLVLVGNTPAAIRCAPDLRTAAARCPVLSHVKRSSLPVVYDQDYYVKSRAMDLWDRVAPHGYRWGISMAMHLPNHRHFVFGVASDEATHAAAESERLSRQVGDLMLLAVHAHCALERIAGPSSVQTLPVSLSPRELEALRWTRAGKTAWETSAILGIAERTVVHHLVNAMRKLRCVNKHQAVLKAIERGWIR